MRVLILSCNTGGGHNTAAKAVQEVFTLQGDDCVIKDALAFGSQKASDLVCGSYIEIVKKSPKLFGEFYEMGKRVGQYNVDEKRFRSPIYYINKIYSDALHEYIIENKFDCVVCTHIFPAEALTHLRKNHSLDIPIYFVSTDYSISPMLEETLVDVIFTPHIDSNITFTRKGITEDRLVDSGIPVGQRFTVSESKRDARTALNLPFEGKIILVMTGSMGFGDTLEMTKGILEKSGKESKVVVITGNNKELYKDIEEKLGDDSRLVLIGFTDKVNQYMDACDVFLSKPGGLSSTEALVKTIPIVHTAPIPGCESENVEFFTKHHLSLCAKDTEEASDLATKLLQDEFLRNQIVEAQNHYKYANSAKFIVDYIKTKKVKIHKPKRKKKG